MEEVGSVFDARAEALKVANGGVGGVNLGTVKLEGAGGGGNVRA